MMRDNVRSRRNPRIGKDPSQAKHGFPPTNPPLKERWFPSLPVGGKAKIRFGAQFCLHRVKLLHLYVLASISAYLQSLLFTVC